MNFSLRCVNLYVFVSINFAGLCDTVCKYSVFGIVWYCLDTHTHIMSFEIFDCMNIDCIFFNLLKSCIIYFTLIWVGLIDLFFLVV